MPDLKIYYPITFFNEDGELPTEEFRTELCVDAAEIVAIEMDCRDYKGKPLNLREDQIDVHLLPYSYDNVRITGAPVLVEITGYDYPDRMEEIGLRVRRTRDRLEAMFKGREESLLKGKAVNVTFIPIKEGCWA